MRRIFLFTVLAATALSGFAQVDNLETRAVRMLQQKVEKTENMEIEAGVKAAAMLRDGRRNVDRKGVAASEASGEEYVLFGSAMFNSDYENVFSEGGVPVKYPVYIDIDESANVATVENIVDLRDFDGRPATGDYDPVNHTITIASPVDFYYLSDYQTIGMYGEYAIFLRAVTPYGIGYVRDEENLVLNVSDDFGTIVPSTGFAASLSQDDYDCGYFDVIYNACILKKSDGVSLRSNKETIDFGNTYIGNTYKQTTNIYNVGSLATDYVITSSDPSVFAVSEVSGDLQSEEFMSLDIVFTPKEQKDYSAIIYVESEGETLEIRLSGKCEGTLDYNRIVKEGDFQFESSKDFPWLIEQRDGNTVAITSNKGLEKTESALSVSFDVPERSNGILSWNGIYDPRFDSYDELFIYLDGEVVAEYDDVPEPGVPMDVSDSLVIPSGTHTISFSYEKGLWVNAASGYNYGEDISYIYNLSLTSEEVPEFDAELSSENLDFGKLYADSYSGMTKTDKVSLKSTGYGQLEIRGITTDKNFTAKASATTADPQRSIDIEITVNADVAGDIEGNVVIETNAGDYIVKCRAASENLPDYSQIVSSGEFKFDASYDYPFIVENGVAYNCTSKVTDNEETTSYFAAYFTVPEGKTGKLRWSANVDAAEFSYDAYSNDGAACMIDLNYLNSYYEKGDAGYSSFGPDQITNLQPGEHSIVFYYLQCGDGQFGGMDRLSVTDLSLEIEDMPELRVELWQPDNEIDFGDVYSSKVGKKYVTLANTGREALKFLSVDGDSEYFYGNAEELPEPTMLTYATVPVIFDPNGQAGTFEGNVTISTSGGDIAVKCKANSIDARQYLLIEDFELGASGWTFFDCDEYSDGQWEVMEDSYYAYDGNGCLVSSSYVYDEETGLVEVLPDNYAVSPEFSIPEEGATLSYYVGAGNSYYCMETYDLIVGKGTDMSTYQTLESETLYMGGYQLRTFELDDYAGETVNLIFRHHSEDYMDLILLDDIIVKSKKDIGIDDVYAGKAVKYVEYYSADGIKVENPEQGLYIRRTVYDDNTVKTEKIIK